MRYNYCSLHDLLYEFPETFPSSLRRPIKSHSLFTVASFPDAILLVAAPLLHKLDTNKNNLEENYSVDDRDGVFDRCVN